MEVYVKIIEVCPIVQSDYVDKNGQPQIYKSKGFVLHNGNNSVFCEAKGRYAEVLESRAFSKEQWYVADFNINCRTYKDKAGETRYSNDVELTRLNVI